MSDEKPRCLRHRKAMYPSWEEANTDAQKLNREKRNTGHMRAYRARECDCWHIGEDHTNRLYASRERKAS